MKSYIIKFIEGISVNYDNYNLLSNYGNITHNLTNVFNGVVLNTNTTFSVKLPFIDFIEETVDINVKQIQETNYNNENVFWGLDSLDGRIDGKYPFQYTGKGVNVYVFDTGIDTMHPEFDNRAINFDGNGDCGTHGTHVAGIIGGRTTGVAKEANIIGLNVLCGNNISSKSIIIALEKLISIHKKPAILNLSLGFKDSTGSKIPSLDEALQAVMKQNITVIAAAGNDNKNPCNESITGTPGVIVVGSVNKEFSKDSFSNYGDCLTIFGPGNSILSTQPNNSYDYKSGTSQATPFVTGIAALYLQNNPKAAPTEVKNMLIKNAKRNILKNINNSPNLFLNSMYLNATSKEIIKITDFDKIIKNDVDILLILITVFSLFLIISIILLYKRHQIQNQIENPLQNTV